ncbi:MAG TPA: DUF488 domain-containing protein [Bryobacteraceae bacterium]|jgi:uncharacterized protein (DUF488 family)|nr:DUF488 domain-containing protein [Bryobacteraceae bacterium]
MPLANRLNLPSATVKQQIANKITWNDARSAETADFFTIGYTGRKTEDILATLKRFGVQTLLDIRQNPISMYRPELSKGNLAQLLEKNGMLYAHLPQFGVPRDIRAKAIETGSRDVIWTWYDENVVATSLNLHFFLNAFEHPVALMCTEIDPHECHRHRLSLALESMGLNGFDL